MLHCDTNLTHSDTNLTHTKFDGTSPEFHMVEKFTLGDVNFPYLFW